MKNGLINCSVIRDALYYTSDTIVGLGKQVDRGGQFLCSLPPIHGPWPVYWYPHDEEAHIHALPQGLPTPEEIAITSIRIEERDEYFQIEEAEIEDENARTVIAVLKEYIVNRDSAIEALIEDAYFFSPEDHLCWKKARQMIGVQENTVVGYFLRTPQGQLRAILDNSVRNNIEPEEVSKLMNPSSET